MEQYPHFIDVTVKTPAFQDIETGLFRGGAESTIRLICRAEVNGVGKKVAGKDGTLVDYAFLCYMPKTDVVVPVDSEYKLFMDNVTSSGRVKRASNGQLNSRLWL